MVTFFSRDVGRVRGVARAARRMRSRFGGSLELFTLGELVFFDTGRSDLVRIDHFDVTHPFAALRERLDTLGEAAWVIEIVARTTGERDRQPACTRCWSGRCARSRPRRGRPAWPSASACAAWTCSAIAPGWTGASSAAAPIRSRGRRSARAGSCATAAGPAPTRCRWGRPPWRRWNGCGARAGRRRWPRRSGGQGPSYERSSTRTCLDSSASPRAAVVPPRARGVWNRPRENTHDAEAACEPQSPIEASR